MIFLKYKVINLSTSTNRRYKLNKKENKKDRAKIAKARTETMKRTYPENINHSIKRSEIFGENGKSPTVDKNIERSEPEIIFENKDSVSALFDNHKGKTALLNFASYKNPGGGFIKGAAAQEEDLCHESFLYNVLVANANYYEYNNEHKNRALYTDRALYTPDIVFERKNQSVACDVISCSSPNKAASEKYSNVSPEENYEALKNRITLIKDVAEYKKVSTLILGAFGAGVFKQDPEDVAKLFKSVFEKTTVKRLVFAVPGKDENMKVFKKYFG